MGDPAGIGPEVLVKAFAALPATRHADIFVMGDIASLELAQQQTGKFFPIHKTKRPDDPTIDHHTLYVFEPIVFDANEVVQGQISAACGRAAVKWFERAITIALDGGIEGIVTCPINKEARHQVFFCDKSCSFNKGFVSRQMCDF